jgi:hypothetical protein
MFWVFEVIKFRFCFRDSVHFGFSILHADFKKLYQLSEKKAQPLLMNGIQKLTKNIRKLLLVKASVTSAKACLLRDGEL